jgi:hypothetical protein
MLLPNGARAIIDPRKLVDYCLSAEHDEGMHKAWLFRRILGIGQEDVEFLAAALRNAATTRNASQGATDRYGRRYVIDFPLTGPSGGAVVRSVWVIRTGENLPRLVTCYIL